MNDITSEQLSELREDIRRIDDKIGPIAANVAVISDRLERMPEPPPRPCQELKNHLGDHEKIKSLWRRPLVSMVFDFAKMIIIGVACFLIGKR